MDMFGWGHGSMWIIWLLVLVGIVLVLGPLFRAQGWSWRGDGQGGRAESAREILDRRYARGELTKEQYEDMKRTLER